MKKIKKLLSVLLAVMMVISAMPMVVFAETSVVAKIGDVEYTSLAAAVEAAGDEAVIILHQDVEVLPKINKPLTIKGASEYINVSKGAGEGQFGTINGTVTLENLNFVDGDEAIRTDYLSAVYTDLKLVLNNCVFNNLTRYAVMGGRTDSINHLHGELVINGCTFNANGTTHINNYMVYAQCVGKLTVTNSVFNGKKLTKGAIHTGDSTVYATVSSITNNTIDDVARGIQIGNRVADSSAKIDGNTFKNITVSAESKSGAIYIHGNADSATTKITVTNNNFDAATGIENVVYNDDGANLNEFITEFTDNTVADAATYMDENGKIQFSAKVELPEVVINDIKDTLTDSDPDLTFALNFAIKDLENLSKEYLEDLMTAYGNHYVDYVLTVSGLNDADVTFNANGDADGYLSGQYDAWSENWVTVPFEDVTINNGESIYIMEYAAKLMNKPGLRFTLAEVATIVQNFDCGVYFTPEFLAANPELKVELELKIFTEGENGEIITTKDLVNNTFNLDDIVAVVSGKDKQSKYFSTLDAAINAAENGDTVILLNNIDNTSAGATVVNAGVTLDLNGKTVKAANFLSFGDVIDTSTDSVGGIIIDKDTASAFTVFQPDNSHLPIYDTENGCYRFFEYSVKNLGSQYSSTKDLLKFGFEIRFNSKKAYELIAADPSGLEVVVDLQIDGNGSLNQKFTYTCDSSVLAKYANTVISNYELFESGTNIALTFSTYGISRLNDGASISATPTMSSPTTRVSKTGNTKTFSK